MMNSSVVDMLLSRLMSSLMLMKWLSMLLFLMNFVSYELIFIVNR